MSSISEMATARQIEIANEAVGANLDDDGLPKFDSAQGYACALTAVMLCDARVAEMPAGMLYDALSDFVHHHRNGGRPYTKDILAKAEAALRTSDSRSKREAPRRETGSARKGESGAVMSRR